ncbi:MAG: glycosyltransferase [Chloroflexi bacterium]|nr:glycosyltransferase [Chloroflexota bacterium]
MRILIAVHGYPPTHNGGAERRAERTARGLAARGHDVYVVSIETLVAAARGIRWEDVREDQVFVRRLFCNFDDAPDMFNWSYDNPQIGQMMTGLLMAWRPDIVHLFSGYLMSASTVRAAVAEGVPVVVSLTDYWWLCHRINLLRPDGSRCDGPTAAGCARCLAESRRRFRLPAQAWPQGANAIWSAVEQVPAFGAVLGVPQQVARHTLLADTLNQCAALIAPSRYLAETYVRHGTDPRLVRVQRQGVELDRCQLRRPASELRFAYLGQLKPHKGVDLLLQAWGQLIGDQPRRLALYGSADGEPDYFQLLQSMAANLAGVTFGGQLNAAGVWQVLAETDVLVMPVRWFENSPNIILEAQAVGVPVVGAGLGGVAELVQHEQNGLLHIPDDARDLARQMQRMLDEPHLIGQLRRNVMPFQHVDDEVDQIVTLYADVTARQEGRLNALQTPDDALR